MRRTRSVPHIEWPGFDGNPYLLDAEVVLAMAISVKGTDAKQELTIDDLFDSYPDAVVKEEWGYDKFISGENEYELRGTSFHVQLAIAILNIRAQGLNPFYVWWQFSDHDWTNDGGQERYSFFVTSKDRIVFEAVSFSDSYDSGFNPLAFKRVLDQETIWHNYAPLNRALAQENYRRYYTDTKIGRLMFLRDDPGHGVFWRHEDNVLDALLNLIAQIHTLKRIAIWILSVMIATLLLSTFRCMS